MPGSSIKYANLSIEAKRADKLKRTFDVSKITGRSYSAWCIGTLEAAMERILYINKAFPNLQILENSSNRFIIEDTKANKIVKIEWKDNKAVCNEKDSDNYILFALLHPDFRLS